jgi:hypothetical protein
MQQQAEVVALGDVLHDFARPQPEEMDLPLPEKLAGWGYSLEFPSMPPRHGCPHGHPLILRNRFDILEPKLREGRPQPGAGGEKALGTFEVPIRLLAIIFRFPIDEIRGDDLVSYTRITGLDKAKRGDRKFFVLRQAHFTLRTMSQTICLVRMSAATPS